MHSYFKKVATINHTKNIQGKDFERLPYPFWVQKFQKSIAISKIQELIKEAQLGNNIDLTDKRISTLNEIFENTQFFYDKKSEKNYYSNQLFQEYLVKSK